MTGDHCEECAVGFYANAGNGTSQDCAPCPCPGGPFSANQFSPTCVLASDGQPTCNNCSKGHSGRRCEVCADGYFGQPMVRRTFFQETMRRKCCAQSLYHERANCRNLFWKLLKTILEPFAQWIDQIQVFCKSRSSFLARNWMDLQTCFGTCFQTCFPDKSSVIGQWSAVLY